MRSPIKNVNLPWLAITCLAIWFFCIHTPPFWMRRQPWQRDWLLATHIIAAGTIYLACIHNGIFTPFVSAPKMGLSTSSCRWMHTCVGGIGMVASLVSVALGAYLSWSRLGRVGEGATTLASAIPLSFAGLGQLRDQYFGYTAIQKYKALGQRIESAILQRDKTTAAGQSSKQEAIAAKDIEDLRLEQREALRLHVKHMIGLFAAACAMPAVIRLAILVAGRYNLDELMSVLALIGIFLVIATRYINVMESSLLQTNLKRHEE